MQCASILPLCCHYTCYITLHNFVFVSDGPPESTKVSHTMLKQLEAGCQSALNITFMFLPSLLYSFPSQTLVDICRLLPLTKVPELVVSLVALAVLIAVKEINACYRQKLPLPIPIELIVVSPLFGVSSVLPFSLILQVCSPNSPAGGILITGISLG